MKPLATLTAIFAAALILTPLASDAKGRQAGAGANQPMDRAQLERGQRDYDRDRMRDRDWNTSAAHDRDRTRDQDRTHAPDFAKLSDEDIYGHEVMSEKERDTYRKQLQKADSSEERHRIEEQHRHEMQLRSEAQGVQLGQPGQDIYGGAMMSVEERNRYREQLRLVESDPEQKTRFMAQHQEKMQVRANAEGIDLDTPDAAQD